MLVNRICAASLPLVLESVCNSCTAESCTVLLYLEGCVIERFDGLAAQNGCLVRNICLLSLVGSYVPTLLTAPAHPLEGTHAYRILQTYQTEILIGASETYG